ncbi:hypothetical protein, partial [Streptococcus anginosus]|uniref:hypothetical protein n=2 Tax=Streptococcus anginosus TaxID=1328 RepID=UPI0021F91E8C
KGEIMQTREMFLSLMQSVLDELKASDNSRYDGYRTRTLSLLSEAYDSYSTIKAFEDAESH